MTLRYPLRRQHAAVAVRDRGLAIGDLAGVAFAAQLACRLDQQEQSVHAGMAIGEPAAIGVDRQTAAGRIVLGSSESYSKLEKINQCLEAITPAYLFTLLVGPSIIADPNFIDAPPPRTRYLCGDFDLNPETVGSKSEFL